MEHKPVEKLRSVAEVHEFNQGFLSRRERLERWAEVLERQNQELRGKGYALAFAFEKLLAEGTTDAVVVVDADTIVSAHLLDAYAARLAAGAVAVQAHYGVQNPNASWRTRLMRIALAMFHQVEQQVEDLRTGRDHRGPAGEFPPVWVEHTLPEHERHSASLNPLASGSRSRHGPPPHGWPGQSL